LVWGAPDVGNHTKAKTSPNLKLPTTDPVLGLHGGLAKLWKRGWLEICRVGTNPHQDGRQKTDHARVAGKSGGAGGHPRRSESRFIPSGIEISAGNTVAPPSALVRASVPDTAICPWPMPFGIATILA
jgi:hypothetical protein